MTEWRALPGPRHDLAEEPTLDGRRVLYVDVPRGSIWCRGLSGPPTLLQRLPPPISAARPVPGGLVVASGMDIVWPGRRVTVPRDPVRWQVNGLIVLPDGALLLGLLSRDRSEPGELLRVDGDAVTIIATGVRAANGLCLDAERGLVWHVDTYARTLTRRPVDRLGDGTVVSTLDGIPGRPDGVCVAADGGVWLAMWDGGCVVHVDPLGAVRETLAVPVSRPTCPLQLPDSLLVTTARSPRDHPLDGRVLIAPLG